MPTPPVSEQTYLETLAAVEAHGSRAAAAIALNINWTSVNNRLRRGRELYGETAEPLIGIPSGFAVKGTSSLVGADGIIKNQWVKTTRETIDTEALASAIESRFSKLATIPKSPLSPNDPIADLLSLYVVADAHIGMHAWGRESGEDYDLSKGISVVRGAIDRLVSGSPESETGVILELGDFFHADDSTSKTPKSGHPLDTDGRHMKVLEAGVDLTIWAIQRALEKHDKVVYVSKRGNHDPTSGLVLPIAMARIFADNPRVTVDRSPSKHWFHQHGDTMLAATHGDTLKIEKFPEFVAAERAQMWGQTKYRYGWTGHLHHRRAIESPGITCEIARTIAARDSYHAAGGYCSMREMLCVVYSQGGGEVQRANTRPYS